MIKKGRIVMSKKLSEMQIILLDRNQKMVDAWERFFNNIENVRLVCSDFGEFMDNNKVQCVVSPANSYGLMDGGYDLAISEWFGWDLQKKVQKFIIDNLYGEQPIGTSIMVETGKDGIKLIHTPTMRYPDKIRDALVVYQCMRSCLILAIKKDIESIVIPAFGGFYGQLQPDKVDEMMWRAYRQLSAPPKEISWEYVDKCLFYY
jgi:O-acetyl-ADP-ribose deacetylase (regulator of RNase III)